MNFAHTVMVIGIAGLQASCLSLRELSFHEKDFSSTSRNQVVIDRPGYIRAVVRSTKDGFKCADLHAPSSSARKGSQAKNQKPDPTDLEVKLTLADAKRKGKKTEGVGRCDPQTNTFMVRFGVIFEPGQYTLKAESKPEALGSIEMQARFLPTDAERDSGPDQLYQGATALSLAAAKGTISSVDSDQTDWWVFKPEALGTFEFVFEHNADLLDVEALLYIARGDKLTLLKTMQARKPFAHKTSSPVFIRIKSAAFTPKAEYSVAATKSLGQAPATNGAQAAQVSAPTVTDMAVLNVRSSGRDEAMVTLAAGTNQGIVKGERIRLFDMTEGNREVEPCVVQALTSTESLCLAPLDGTEQHQYKAKRGAN